MSLLRRFGYYFFGVALGSMLVYVMLIRDRDFPAWLPEDRVLEEIAVDSIAIAENLTVTFSDRVLRSKLEDAEVHFKKSIVRNEPCREYQIETALEHMRFKLCDSVPELILYDLKEQ